MELVDIVNKDGEFIRTQNRNDLMNENEYFKSVHIYLLRNNKDVYIQQRSEYKKENPNLWEVAGGGVISKEEVTTAAIREIKEETGIEFMSKDLISIGTLICDKYLVNAFVAFVNDFQIFSPQYEEIKNTLFVPYEEILELINNDRFYSSSFGLFQKYYGEHIDGKI